MVRLLLIYVVAVFVVAAGAIWAIYEFNLLPVNKADAITAPPPKGESFSIQTAGGTLATRSVKPNALVAHDLGGRDFRPSPLPLSLPLDCQPGVDCWVFNYVDADPGKGRADFACGQMSYDTHKGTDIALAHTGRLDELVAVRAAAAGKVLGVRDGMKDVSVRQIGRAAVKGKECGNGVRVDHGGGWHTQYCHMKRGTVSVKSGDLVRTGDRIGAVGLSGLTEFPHVHMTVEKDGKVVDPFVGLSGGENCDIGAAPLWRREVLEKLRYLSAIPYNMGFADRLPTAQEIRSGAFQANSLSASSPTLVFWSEIAGLRPGDFVSVRFFDPDGAVLASKEESMAKHQIRIWRAIGKRSKNGWAPGAYRGEVTILRQTPAGPSEARRSIGLDVF